jgi:hypothetical protein
VGFRCGGLKEDLAAGFFYFDFSKGGEERRGEVYTETIILRYGNKLGLGLDFCCW